MPPGGRCSQCGATACQVFTCGPCRWQEPQWRVCEATTIVTNLTCVSQSTSSFSVHPASLASVASQSVTSHMSRFTSHFFHSTKMAFLHLHSSSNHCCLQGAGCLTAPTCGSGTVWSGLDMVLQPMGIHHVSFLMKWHTWLLQLSTNSPAVPRYRAITGKMRNPMKSGVGPSRCWNSMKVSPTEKESENSWSSG